MRTPSDSRLVLLLSRAYHALFRNIDRVAAKRLGVTSAQIGPLFYVAKNPGCVQGDVGRELGINKAATSKLIGRMERADLIERRPRQDDGRALALYLRPHARDVLDAARPVVRALNRQLTDGFSAAEMEVIARFLSAVAERFKE